MIVDPDFLDHWRTRTLVGLLDGDEMAPLYVLRIWSHCQNRRQTHHEPMGYPGVSALCRYTGDSNRLVSSLVESGFIEYDETTGAVAVPKWADKNAQLLAAWGNGSKGGRPKKVSKKPTGSRVEKSRVEKSRVEKKENKSVRMTRPTVDECKARGLELELPAEQCEEFYDFYESKGWLVGKSPMQKWRASMALWKRNYDARTYSSTGGGQAGRTQKESAEARRADKALREFGDASGEARLL